MSDPRTGVVLRDEGSSVLVDLGDEQISCVIRKSLRRGARRKAKAVVVGDRVRVEFSGEGAAVVEVEARRSLISRPDPSQPRREQLLVANVDAVLVVASARDPDLAPGLIDRFLVAAESRDLEVGIVVNKIDLDPGEDYAPIIRVYRDLGYSVLPTSAETGAGLQEVREFLAPHTTTMLGHSGVGKSSLANALDPDLSLRTAEVHARSGQGMHTTSAVSLLRLPWGGYLVDTPGIREFGLWEIEEREVGFWFRDLAKRVQACRFNDCLHEGEPGCAVKESVESGEIAAWRYDSYLRILETLRADTPDPY